MKGIFFAAAAALSLASCGGGGSAVFQPGTIAGNADVNLVPCDTNGPSATPSSFSMAINGAGNFALNASGEMSYAKSGTFHLEIGTMACAYSDANLNTYYVLSFDGYLAADSGQRLSGYVIDDSGKLTDVNVFGRGDMPPRPTTSLSAQVNLDSRVAALSSVSLDAASAVTFQFSTLTNFFDTLGNAHTLRLNFVKVAGNTWDVFAASDDATSDPSINRSPSFLSGVAQLVFDANGVLTSATQAMSISASDYPLNGGSTITSPATTVLVAVPVMNGAVTPVLFGLDFAGTTQKAEAFKTGSISQDGYRAGRVNGFSIGSDGKIVSRYDNGQARITGQVAIVPFQ